MINQIERRFILGQKIGEQRQSQILDILLKNSKMEVNELAEKLNVTQATVRRDLTILEKKGKLYRTHGGAILKDQPVTWQPTSLEERLSQNSESKKQLAKAMAKHINDNDSIIIDGSSTNIEIAKELVKTKKDLLIVTNSQYLGCIFLKDESLNNQVFIIGGELLFDTQNTVGPLAENILRTFRVSKSIIGLTGIIPEEGLFSASPQESEIKRIMIKNGSKVFVVFDSSKIGIHALSKFNDFEDIDYLITNSDVSESDKNTLKEKVKTVEFI